MRLIGRYWRAAQQSAGFWPAVLLLAVLLAYLPSLSASFQFDDFNVIVDNPAVHWLQAWWQGAAGIRPLLKLSYALNWQLSSEPAAWRLVNIALHAGNSLLLFAILHYLPLPARLEPQRGALAAFAALLFALHPVQTEAVTYISGRSVSLMSTFYLASLLCWLRGNREQQPLLSLVLSPLLFLAAVLVKEVAVTLPLLLWLLHRCGAAGDRPLRYSLWPHALLLLGMLLAIAGHPRYQQLLLTSLEARPLLPQLQSQLQALGYLLSRLWLPQRLNIDPQLLPASALHLSLLASALGAWIALAIYSRRRHPWLCLILAWPLLVLLPTNSLVPRLDLVSERQFYLAGPLLFWGLALALAPVLNRRRSLALALGGLPLIALLLLTWQRNADYRTEVSLWQAAARLAPDKARIFNNLGYALALSGDHAAARRHYERALQLQPDYARARANLRALPDLRKPPEKTQAELKAAAATAP